MAPLALAVCTAFVLFLLLTEWRSSRVNSPALWLPTLFTLIVASRPLATWFVYTGPGGVILKNDDGNALDRWILIGLALPAVIVLVRRRIDWAGLVRRNKWLIVLLLFMCLSTFWSGITAIALKRWIRELIAPVMALVIMSEKDHRQAFASVLRRTAYVLLPISLLLIKYYPWLGVRYGKYSGTLMWVGVTGQKNHLGRLCAVCVLFLLFALYTTWRDRRLRGSARPQIFTDICIVLLAVYLLIGSHSSTSLVTAILGIMIFSAQALAQRRHHIIARPVLLMLVIVFIAFGVATPFLEGKDVADFTANLGRDATLTGRTDIWKSVMPARELHPLLGYGYASFWTDARRKAYDIPSAHNGYLDVLLEVGEVGFVLNAFWLLSCARQLHRLLPYDFNCANLGISFLFMGLLYNTSESALNSLSDHMTLMTLFAAIVLAPKRMAVAKALSVQKRRTVQLTSCVSS